MVIYKPSGRAGEYAEWACNLYTGCTHGCVYCYAPSVLQRKREDFHAEGQPRKDIIGRLTREARRMAPAEILLCFVTDPYQPSELEYGVTRQAIENLHAYGHAVQILTKGGTRAVRDFDLLTARDAFAATLTFVDPAKSREWEPGAAEPADRFDALRLAHERGIRTWASLEPVIEPEETLEIIRRTAAFVDLYKVGPLNYHPAAAVIDWRAFGRDVVGLFDRLGLRYYLKADLRKHLA